MKWSEIITIKNKLTRINLNDGMKLVINTKLIIFGIKIYEKEETL